MGGSCSTHGRDEKCVQPFWSVNLKIRDHAKVLGLGGEKLFTGNSVGSFGLDASGSG